MAKKGKKKKETIDVKLTYDELTILKELLKTEMGRCLSSYTCDMIKSLAYKIMNMESEAS